MNALLEIDDCECVMSVCSYCVQLHSQPLPSRFFLVLCCCCSLSTALLQLAHQCTAVRLGTQHSIPAQTMHFHEFNAHIFSLTRRTNI